MTDESDAPPAAPGAEPTWALVANLHEDVDHEKVAPGAKVYVHSCRDGAAASVEVVGRHRSSRRWIVLELPRSELGNWRVKRVHRPGLLERLADGEVADEATARSLCERLATDDAGTSPAPD